MCVCERERERVTVNERDRETVCVCERERDRPPRINPSGGYTLLQPTLLNKIKHI